MINDRRRFWTSILFVGLFAPLVVCMLILLTRLPSRAARAAATAGQGAAGGGAGLGGMFSPVGGAGPAILHADNAPLLAASDGRELWVVHPALLRDKDVQLPVYRVLHRSPNVATWSLATHRGETFWGSYPQGVAVLRRAVGGGVPYVFNDRGTVASFVGERKYTEEELPSNHLVKAAAGSEAGVFALTYGTAVGARVGERLTPDIVYSTPAMELVAPPATVAATTAGATTAAVLPETGPATQGAGTQAATQTATQAATATAPAAGFQAFVMRESHWYVLPPLGETGNDVNMTPTPSSHVALAVSGKLLVAMWVDPLRPNQLVVRTLEAGEVAATMGGWSAPVVTTLSEELPAKTRLLPAVVEKSLYLFWTVPTGDAVVLRGGRLAGAAEVIAGKPLSPWTVAGPLMTVSLSKASAGISPEMDVAVAGVENSLVAVFVKEAALQSLTFNVRGEVLTAAGAVELAPLRPNGQVGQNMAMIMLLLVFTLTLWQWRQKPTKLALPAGMVAAPLTLRAAAFLIDAAIPYVIVVAAFGLWESPVGTGLGWLRSLARPDELLRVPEFLVFIAIYLAHVTLGELVFRRSIGKLLVGLQILMIDGKAPTLAAILLRNLVRLPESILGLVVFYLFISDHHQRLGDLLARTLVISQAPPKMPEDPDAPAGPKG